MLDFAAARRMMVDCQVRTSDVTDLRLIAAMLAVPRERFVPKASAELAYLDADLPVEAGRGLSKPMVLAKLLQAREQLANLQRYMDGKVAAEDQLKALLKDPELMRLLNEKQAAEKNESETPQS